MREIKFRAWDDEAKKMYSPEGLEQPDVKDDTKKSIYCYLSYGVLQIYDFREKEPVQFVPMQSTGWFDKERNEIYEGDVVQIEDAIYQIIWRKEISGFILLSTDGVIMMGGDYITDDIEICGNIYENPELINYKY
ncbi:MAG TPA: hypothetical protein DCM73_01390 [Clostridiales bacterium]|nr:hypothetical protein [Clostridiales bacterium]